MVTTNHTVTLDQIRNDLKSFLEFCKENQLSDDDIAKICQPLTASIKRAQIIHNMHYLALFILIAIILYFLTYFEFVSWNLSAISRIFLIKLLPYWDWRHLKHEKCLMENFNFYKETSTTPIMLDCVLCEAINKIHVEPQIDGTILNTHYIELDKPVILPDALSNWPIYQDPSLHLIEDATLQDSFPCKLSSNIHRGSANLRQILQKTENFDEFFLHFQNCDFEVIKAFRILAPRPIFLPDEISPIQYNWLLLSKNYNVSNYKGVELTEPITVIGQAAGNNLYRLIPRHNCEDECPTLNIELARGEALVFTSLWNLEYKPSATGENIAVVLEMH